MPATKKRSLPGDTVGATSSTKKRKTDANMPKFYAVKTGMIPGVYLTWKECQEQTSGFRGAVYKSFTSLEDAQAFVAGKKVASAKDASAPPKFYAVAKGAFTGIFTDWDQASLAIKGQKGPKYKKFGTRHEAVNFIKMYGDKDAIAALGEEGKTAGFDIDDQDDDSEDYSGNVGYTSEKFEVVETERPSKKTAARMEKPVLVIYTDGCSLRNGQHGAAAGVGVYFAHNDSRNVSEPLHGELQTNQRAELTAILKALTLAPLDQPVRICSDSKYSISCATTWAEGWEKRGWKTTGGDEVKNKDLVQAIRAKLAQRRASGAETFFEWVRGHSGDPGNTEADRLANAGARQWWGQ